MRTIITMIFMTVALVAGVVQPVEAWTYRWTGLGFPAGSSATNLGGVGGGIFRFWGTYHIPSAGHVLLPHGAEVFDQTGRTDGGYNDRMGIVSNSTGAGGAGNDMGLVQSGSDPVPAYVRLNTERISVPINEYATGLNNQLPIGATACISGWSWKTQALGGSRCGTLQHACTSSYLSCVIGNPDGMTSGGDSGALVWQSSGRGVRILGWITHGGTTLTPDGHSYTTGRFTTTWALSRKVWSAEETAPGGFWGGNDPDSCFVTTTGCQRIN